ncbi:MMPL family transporter [Actinoplanes sp. NPDC048967]|uniref:MMPL family transporter n=1 Tax=Actinoplanes sp. NPDC048967 TaxID=3155269 RepID=UPI0033C31D70
MAGRPRRSIVGAYARLVVRLRWFIVVAWAAVAVAGPTVLPGPSGGSGGVDGFVSVDSPAIQTELRSVQIFGFPLLSRVAVVQRDASGLSPLTQAESIARAAAVTQGQYDDLGPILGAIPVPNTFGAFPGARESGTTVITLLFMPPSVGFNEQTTAARSFVANHFGPEDSVVGVTGTVPARTEQGAVLQRWLTTVEIVTLAVVVFIVAMAFRSLLAPLLALVTAGTAILVTLSTAGAVAGVLGVSVPDELEPLLVALLLGVVTDYVIFYLFGMRRELSLGASRLVAAERATARFTPIVTVAGVTVACGTGALLVARSPLFQAFGPGMALAVLIGMAVAVTLAPAMLAILGGAVFWPSRPRIAPVVASGATEVASTRWTRLLVRRSTAAGVLIGCVGALLFMAAPARNLDLGLSFVPSLPSDNSVRQAAVEARTGFSEGIVSPTVLLVESKGITGQRVNLEKLGALLEQRPGVAGVLGPGDQALPTELGLVLSRDGNAARYLIVLDDQPLGASAVDTVAGLQDDLPGLLRAAGLPGAQANIAGDTAIAEGVVTATMDDLKRITIATLMVNVILLVIFLGAVVAPLYLLAANLLALCATLGLTTWVFQDLLGHDGLTFYVPFAAAVLLVALGSDYNIFSVGQVWHEAWRRPLRSAMLAAIPQSTRTVTAAGVTLAASFGLLALVPLSPFRELAFAMAVGILLDAILVRSLLVPALLTLVGPVSGWPGRRLRRSGRDGAPDERAPAAGATPAPPPSLLLPPPVAAAPLERAAPAPPSRSRTSRCARPARERALVRIVVLTGMLAVVSWLWRRRPNRR